MKRPRRVSKASHHFSPASGCHTSKRVIFAQNLCRQFSSGITKNKSGAIKCVKKGRLFRLEFCLTAPLVPTDPGHLDVWFSGNHLAERSSLHRHATPHRAVAAKTVGRERRRAVRSRSSALCRVWAASSISSRNRLRTNSQQSHEATLAQLVSLQNLFSEAQAKLEHLTTLATAPAASPVEAEVSPAPLLDDSPAPEHELAAALEEPAAVSDIDTQGSTIRRQQLSLEEVRTLDDAWTLTRETVEEHETLAAAVAGAVGALVLSGLLSALAR